MTKLNNMKPVILIISFCLYSYSALAQDMKASLEGFEKQSLLRRNLQQALIEAQSKIQWTDVKKQQEIAAKLLQATPLAKSRGDLGNDFFRYYDARMRILAGERNIGLQEMASLAGSDIVAPEAIDAFFEVSAQANLLWRTQHTALLGKIIPISSFGMGLDAQGTIHYADAEQQPIPAPDVRHMITIANQLLMMKLYERSSVAAVEAIYAGYAAPQLRSRTWETWLSQVSAPLWLQAADAEWQSGNLKKATGYMAKAIIFSSESTKNEALQLLRKWSGMGLPLKPPATEPDAARLETGITTIMPHHSSGIATNTIPTSF